MNAAGQRESLDAAPESGWSALARWLLVLALIIFVPLMLVAVIAVFFFLGYLREQKAAAAAAEQEVAQLEAAGQPMSAKTLYAYHRARSGVPDTTAAWQAALSSFDPLQFSADARSLPYVGDGDREHLRPSNVGSELASAESFLQTYDATLQATLVAAKERGECRFPLKFEDGVSASADRSQQMRTLVRLLALSLRVRACRGDAEGALESLNAMFAASDATAHQLTSVEQLLRMATLGMALSEAEFLLNEAKLTDEQLAQLAERVAASDVQAGFAEGLVGERALSHVTISQLPNIPFSADRLKSLQLISQAITASREPFPEGRVHFQKVAAQLKAEQASAGALARQKYALTVQHIPSLTASFDAAARSLAYQRVLLTAIAAQRFRLKNGPWPAQLADLVPGFLPAVPTDPFDGQPLRMLSRDGELLIYSVGKDEKDDFAANPPGNPSEPDVVVRLK